MANLLPSATGEVGQKWTLNDGDRELAVSNTWEHLEEALLQFPKKAFTPNTIVDFISPQEDIMSFGIAGKGDDDNPGMAEPLACINYVDRTQNPPYLTVVGNPALSFENGGVVVFRYEEGTWTEILRRNCVPVDVMIRVAKHFFTTGTLPDWIGWEEV